MSFRVRNKIKAKGEDRMHTCRMFRASLLFLSLLILIVFSAPAFAKVKSPTLKIIKDGLFELNNYYFVKGTVYNPSAKAVKNVVIKYYIWKKWMGQEGHGYIIRDTGGLVTATIKYIPPKTSIEFTASSRNAPVMTLESGLLPDPLEAEITAEWDK
jgi:hypothetical protein